MSLELGQISNAVYTLGNTKFKNYEDITSLVEGYQGSFDDVVIMLDAEHLPLRWHWHDARIPSTTMVPMARALRVLECSAVSVRVGPRAIRAQAYHFVEDIKRAESVMREQARRLGYDYPDYDDYTTLDTGAYTVEPVAGVEPGAIPRVVLVNDLLRASGFGFVWYAPGEFYSLIRAAVEYQIRKSALTALRSMMDEKPLRSETWKMITDSST